MSLRVKVLAPLALCGLIMAAYLGWGSLPRGLQQVARSDLLALLAVGFLLLFGAAWLAFEEVVAKPLARIALAAGSAETARRDEIAQVARAVQALRNQLDRKQRALEEVQHGRRQIERALNASEERYVLAVRSANDGLWEWNLDSGEVYLSPRWKGMLGFGDDELHGTADEWRRLIHPDDRAAVDAALEATLQGQTPRYEHPHRLVHKDGGARWILSRGAAIRHANGKPYRLIGLDTDVTAVKRVESLLDEIVAGTTGTYGDAFYRSLVKHFAGALRVPCAFITSCADDPPTRLRTLAFWTGEGFRDNFEYDLLGTPCYSVVNEGKTCFLPAGVGELYPVEAGWEGYLGIPLFACTGKVIGHLAFLDKKEMAEDMRVDSIYRIFTSRAAAELERHMALEELRERGVNIESDATAALAQESR